MLSSPICRALFVEPTLLILDEVSWGATICWSVDIAAEALWHQAAAAEAAACGVVLGV